MFKNLKARRREYQRRFDVLQTTVREEPGEIDGTPVVNLVVDDETAWRKALAEVAEVGSWPLHRPRRHGVRRLVPLGRPHPWRPEDPQR